MNKQKNGAQLPGNKSGWVDRLCQATGLPSRYGTLALLGAVFFLLNTLVRLGLLIFDGESANFELTRLSGIFLLGAIYDLAALSYLFVPFVLIAWFVPDARIGRRIHALLSTGLLIGVLGVMVFTAASEGVFWNEFSSRFNFIAVDYLVYTREVVGNIRQSYPLGWMLSAVALAVAALLFFVGRPYWKYAAGPAAGLARRSRISLLLLALPAACFLLIGDQLRDRLATPSARELAGNGYYDFMRAFRSNDLDYRAFYRMLPSATAKAVLRGEFSDSEQGSVATGHASMMTVGNEPDPVVRKIQAGGARLPYNVVLVSMESLGADYVESFGGRPGLTPNLDRFAREGLMFTQMYATGLRTVRGLEALTLSIPPTPGHAVPMRKNNKGYQTLGGVFAEQGYEPMYVYGGYSYFDNMNDFFGGNGYTVIDRSAIADSAITHETIWGVADEDLFRLAIREIDKRVAAGRRVFAHVMTTSNHRPFTFPQGRIDLRSGAGRDAAVKYSDWAIGQFVREASTHAWFHDTVFVFVADHTSNGRGRTDLPPENFRIPFIVFAPGIVKPGKVDLLGSQIDVGPTLLGLMNISYTSHFFGHDLLREGERHQRALMANYLTVGYLQNGVMVSLSPKQRVQLTDAVSGMKLAAADPRADGMVDRAIAYYQVATEQLRGQHAPGATAIGQARAATH